MLNKLLLSERVYFFTTKFDYTLRIQPLFVLYYISNNFFCSFDLLTDPGVYVYNDAQERLAVLIYSCTSP